MLSQNDAIKCVLYMPFGAELLSNDEMAQAFTMLICS